MPDTIEVAEDTVRGLAQEVRALRETTERLREELREAKRDFVTELVRVQDFADRMDIARSTVYQRARKRGIPIRDKHGYPKEDGDRSAAYVSVTEWEAGEEIATRTVRKNAGFYD